MANRRKNNKQPVAQKKRRNQQPVKRVIQNNVVARRPPQPKKNKITPAGKFLRNAGGMAGAFLGNAGLGRSLGAGISRIFGQGDYQIQSNSLMRGGPPSFAAMNTGMRIAHREYIGDISSTIGFFNSTLDVNPVSSATFPWLSKIAANFEEYSIKGLVFYYNTTCGSAISSTNNALGTVGLVTVTDPTDPPLGSKRECEDYAGCVAGVPSASLLAPVECKPRSAVLDRYYIQTADLTNPEDKKFYSHGTLNVFTKGMQAGGVVIGELWVSYDIEFYTPKILPIGTLYQAASKAYVVTTTQTATQLLGTTDQTFLGNLGATYTGADGTLRLPAGTAAGYYLVSLAASGTGTYLYNANVWSTNMTLINTFQGNTTSSVSTPNAAGANSWHGCLAMFYKSDAAQGIFGINFNGTPPTGTFGADIVISKIPTQAVTGVPGVFSLAPTPKEISDEFMDKIIQRLKQSKMLESIQENDEIIL